MSTLSPGASGGALTTEWSAGLGASTAGRPQWLYQGWQRPKLMVMAKSDDIWTVYSCMCANRYRIVMRRIDTVLPSDVA